MLTLCLLFFFFASWCVCVSMCLFLVSLSARRNLEVNITILDPCIASRLESHFERDLAQCSAVTLETLKSRGLLWRLLHRFAYFTMRYMPFPLVAIRAFFTARRSRKRKEKKERGAPDNSNKQGS